MSKRLPEHRYIDAEYELRSLGNSKREFEGYAAVFNQEAEIHGEKVHFRETVIPGAFTRTLREQDIAFLFNHEASTIMARTSAGTLDLGEDNHGLHTRATLNEKDDDARQLITKLEDRNVDKMSFGFWAVNAPMDMEPEDGGLPQRSLAEVGLSDVSTVVWPAYEGTSAGVRGIDVFAETRAALEARGIVFLEEGEERANMDNSAWDGNAAMSACSDASCYSKICAGRRAGDPDLRATWALPHHKTPSSPANTAGVRNALSRLSQAQGLINATKAKSHLQAHLDAASGDAGRAGLTPPLDLAVLRARQHQRLRRSVAG